MEDDCLSKLLITKSGHRATQYKNILDALSSFYNDKNYKYIDDIISTNTELTEAYFLPAYPVRIQQSSAHYMSLRSVDPIVGIDVPSGASSTCIENYLRPKSSRTSAIRLQPGVKT